MGGKDDGCLHVTISIKLHDRARVDEGLSKTDDDIGFALSRGAQVLEYFGGVDHGCLSVGG